MKNRTDNPVLAHEEISYYDGIEDILGGFRALTILQVDDRNYVHCVETNYRIAKEVIGVVIPNKESVLARVAG